MVGSTAYFEKYGDEAGLALVAEHNRLLVPCIERHGGRLVKTIGDALMAAFGRPAQAVRAAVEMQQALKQRNIQASAEHRILVRMGINFGEVLVQQGDLFGDAVNAAARIEALAGPGMILISAQVRRALLPEWPDLVCLPYDAVLVKGKSEPIEVFEVQWDPQAGPAAGPRPVASAGEIIGGRFQVQALLGEGGMGQVFSAFDRVLEEPVALKFIHPRLAGDQNMMERFKAEVKLARSITHPNVCRIHELMQMEGRTFISMELVEGQPLEEVIRQEAPFSEDRVKEILHQVADALSAAHRRGVVHQDLKPANILIERKSGRAVITDFGIARLAGQASNGDGMVVGTPQYMSPEQAQGLAAGPASDIYALGAIVFEMLAGRPPFEGVNGREVMEHHISQPPPDLEKLRPGISPVMAQAVGRCLEKDPRRRFQSAAELAAFLGLEAPPARPVRWLLWSLLGLVALALVSFWWLRPAGPPGGTKTIQPLAAAGSDLGQLRFSPSAARLAAIKGGELVAGFYQKLLFEKIFSPPSGRQLLGFDWKSEEELLLAMDGPAGSELWQTGPYGARQLLFPSADCLPDYAPDRGLVVSCRKNASGTLDLVLGNLQEGNWRTLIAGDSARSFSQPRWSPDGQRLALVVEWPGFRTARDLALVDAEGTGFTLLTEDGRSARFNNTDPVWSPDGRWLVYSSRRGGTQALWCLSISEKKSYPLAGGATSSQLGPEISPDGSQLLFRVVEERHDIALLELQNGWLAHLGNPSWNNRFPAWSPDGVTLAFRASPPGEEENSFLLVVQRIGPGSEEKTYPLPPGSRELAWCGRERIVLARTAGEDRRLELLQLSDGAVTTLAEGFSGLWSPQADPECHRVVFSAVWPGESGRQIWLYSMPEKKLRALTPVGGFATFPALSPDGRQIAHRYAPQDTNLGEVLLKVVDLQGRQIWPPLRHPSFSRSQRRLRWAADGKSIYFLEADGPRARLRQWRPGGEPQILVTLQGLSTFDFDLTPDGRRLVYPRLQESSNLFVMKDIQW